MYRDRVPILGLKLKIFNASLTKTLLLSKDIDGPTESEEDPEAIPLEEPVKC